MVEYEDECVGCPPEMSCPNMNVPHYYCDECGDETTLYQYGDLQLCEKCLMEYIKDEYKIVEGSKI